MNLKTGGPSDSALIQEITTLNARVRELEPIVRALAESKSCDISPRLHGDWILAKKAMEGRP